MNSPSRRALLGSGLALAACKAESQPAMGPVAPLKSLAPFPIGTCVQASQFDDPVWANLTRTHFSQLTPEWEMKMEYIVREDGGLRFERPDTIVDVATANGLKVFGHALVWYAQKPPAFERLDENRVSFGQAYDNYITAVVGRYRGRLSGWDVVNEAVLDSGAGLRTSLWSQRLGELDHMVRAYHVARAADPTVPLFINDYNLETIPAKLTQYLRLIERLLKAGAPLSGIGTQTHVAASLTPGSIRRTVGELARFGLPVHIAEMDVSTLRDRGMLRSDADVEAAQGRLYAEAMEAFAALHDRQRFAFTVWGVRDRDSWLYRENAKDRPLLFDSDGRPKPALAALESVMRG